MGIAYLPIDIETNLPSEDKIINYCNRHMALDKGVSPYWDTFPIFGRLPSNEWYDVDKLLGLIRTKTIYTGNPGSYLNDFDKEFPEIVSIIDQLPFKELAYAILFRQTSLVEPHIDRSEDEQYDLTIIEEGQDVRALELEPKRYNILLTKHNYKSFYISEQIDSTRIYPVIPKNRSCIAFANDQHYHGADYVGEDKVMLFLSGSLDKEKHLALIKRSLEKYKSEAIIF